MSDESSPSIENVEDGRSLGSDRRSENEGGVQENVRRCLPFSKCQIATTCIALLLFVGFCLCIHNTLNDPESYDRVSYGYLACLSFVGLMMILYCTYPTSRIKFAALLISCMLLVVSGIYISFAAAGEEEENFMTNALVSVFCLIGFVGLFCYSIPSQWSFSPSSCYNRVFRRAAAPRNGNLQRVDSSDGQASSSGGRQGVDSRCSTNTAGGGSEPEDDLEATGGSDLPTSDSCSYAAPADGLPTPSSDEVCPVATVSEVASTKNESAEAGQATTSTGDRVKVSSEPSREHVSESEGMSSGELRRRKLRDTAVVPESSSSDEEPKVKLLL